MSKFPFHRPCCIVQCVESVKRPYTDKIQLAGNYAKLSTEDLNFAAAEYIGARIVYTALYMTTKSEAMSYLRTGAYAWSLAAPIWILWKAGVKARDGMLEGDGKAL